MARHNKSSVIALGGICSALCIVIMLLSSIIPLATYIAPMLAGFALIPVKTEMGIKSSLTAFAACSLLSLFIIPEKECVMLFIFLLGWYPLAKEYLDKIKSKLLRILSKLLIFNVSILSGYFVLIKLLSMDYLTEEFGGMMLILITLLIGNVTFVIYDRALHLIELFYNLRIRKKFGFK